MSNKKWDKKEIEIRNEERLSIGRNLHDSIGNNILKLQFRISLLKDKIENSAYEQLICDLDSLRNEIRNISHTYVLNNYYLDEKEETHELKNEIKTLLIDFTNIYPDITFLYTTFPQKNKIIINNDFSTNIILSIQELILNAIKHGKADELSVNLTQHSKNITIIIEDNGQGFDMNNKTISGIGLKNISTRMKSIGGYFLIDSKIKYGATATLHIPLKTI